MADDQTKIIISIETVLRNLNRTLQDLDRIEKRLRGLSSIKLGAAGGTSNINAATAATQRAATQSQRLQLQQQRLQLAQQRVAIATQNVSNAQARANLATQRLAQAQQRLSQTTVQLGQQQNRHVQFFRAQQQAAQQFNKTVIATGNALRSLGQGVASVGATLSVTLTAPLIAFGATVTDAAVTLDSLKRGLTTIAGSAQEAQRQLVRLTQIAKLPSIGFEEAVQGSIRLQAVGFSAKEAERALVQFSNAVALTGGGRDELQRITVQLGQLAAKGKVLAQDLRPIIEAAPAVGRALKQAFGTVNADDIAELTGSSEEFLKILIAQLEQLPRAAAGARNSFENFRDEVFRASAAIGTALLPALTQLVQIAGPIITRFAELFASLPRPVQTTIFVIGALVAALGPLLFVIGQFATGIGRVIVGLGQLNAIGLIPAIRNLRLYTQGLTTAAVAQRSLTAVAAAGSAILGGLAVTLGIIVAAYVAYKTAQEDATKITEDQLNAQENLVNSLGEQLKFLKSLDSSVKRTTEEQTKLNEIYNLLGVSGKARVGDINNEDKGLKRLTGELEKFIKLKQDEQAQSAATLAAQLANNALTIQANEREIASNIRRIQASADLADAIRNSNKVTGEQSVELAKLGINSATVEEALGALQTQSENLVQTNGKLRETTDSLIKDAQEQAPLLLLVERHTQGSARAFLIAAKNMGTFRGNIEEGTAGIKLYTDQIKEATKETDLFLRAAIQASQQLTEAGKAADEEQKRRRASISSAGSLAREASNNFKDALKFFAAIRRANPQLEADLRREAQLTGKTIEQLISDSIGTAQKGAEAVNNAQEQLADASARVQQEAAEKEIAQQKSKNDELLRLNEERFKQELIGFQEFANERARLQQADIQGEIDRQRKIIELANQDILRARERARATTGTGRVKAEADEQTSIAKRTAAETKIIELQSKQQDIISDTNNEIREFNKDRLKDIRDLRREIDEITGKEKEANEAAIDERFADRLRELNTELKAAFDTEPIRLKVELDLKGLKAQQDVLRAQLEPDSNVTLEQRVDLTRKLNELNEKELQLATQLATLSNAQSSESLKLQIARIEGSREQLKSLVALQDAQEKIRNAEEDQANLERDLQFQVEFRGLREQEAIAQRLEGEKRVRAEIEKQQAAIQGVIDKLRAAGLEVPTALLESVKRFEVATKGLGELSFADQFRAVEDEFNKINDERLAEIAKVEDAINRRTIAEVQGLLKIRLINAEYIGDLEEQSRILTEIAEESGKQELIQQARQVEQTTRDANTELESFNTRLRSVSIDAIQQGLADFFSELGDNTKTAKERILDLINSITRSITDFIARDFSRQIIESIFGTGEQQKAGGNGLLAALKRLGGLFGIGGGGREGVGDLGGTGDVIGGAVAAGTEAAPHAAAAAEVTTAATALTAAGTTAATAMASGGTTAGASLISGGTAFTASVISAGASFVTAVTSAGIAFTTAIAGASTAQAIGGAGGAIGGAFAATGMFPAVPGGLVRIVEGGFPEAVLTTDPKHASQQVKILQHYLRETKGLFGRIPGYEQAGPQPTLQFASSKPKPSPSSSLLKPKQTQSGRVTPTKAPTPRVVHTAPTRTKPSRTHVAPQSSPRIPKLAQGGWVMPAVNAQVELKSPSAPRPHTEWAASIATLVPRIVRNSPVASLLKTVLPRLAQGGWIKPAVKPHAGWAASVQTLVPRVPELAQGGWIKPSAKTVVVHRPLQPLPRLAQGGFVLPPKIEIPGFAQGGFTIARDAEAEMLQSLSSSRSGIPAPSPSLQPVSATAETNLRILNLWDRKQIAGGYIRSAEGARDILNVLSENASDVSRRLSIK